MSLERIEITPFAVIAGDILQNRKTGFLTVINTSLRKVLYWSQGELVMAASNTPEDSLADFLVRRGAIATERAAELFREDPNDIVARVHESSALDLSTRQTLLREWLGSRFVPLFGLDEGTAAFTDEEALPAEKRIFLQSTAALFIEGVRSITNGLVLRRSLGDIKRNIQIARNPRFGIETLPLTEQERTVAISLTEPASIEMFLKRVSTSSIVVAKTVIIMLALGTYEVVEERTSAAPSADLADMQRDLELLAAIGSGDPRSLHVVAFSRQLPTLDHYQVLDVPRAATRAQIMTASDTVRRKYDVATYPLIVREPINTILRRIDEATEVLKDAVRRTAYDKLIHSRTGEGAASIQQRLSQRTIAEHNFAKAKDLAAHGDYYGAIVLLKQAVHFIPEFAEAWQLLGSCQERNPHWRRDAAESFQMALSVDPNNVEAMISLGDLYKSEGMISRAQVCYEDVLKIEPENPQGKSRLQALKKR